MIDSPTIPLPACTPEREAFDALHGRYNLAADTLADIVGEVVRVVADFYKLDVEDAEAERDSAYRQADEARDIRDEAEERARLLEIQVREMATRLAVLETKGQMEKVT